jgi:4'-phosphopantetheinyl transferase
MTLAENAIHLYVAYPGDITDPGLLAQYETLLSDQEQSRLTHFNYDHHRHLYLITRALVRTSLSEYADVKPANWQFGKNRYGKPFISQPSTSAVLKFNISHTAGLVICAITRDSEIGVDVEDRQRSTRSAFSSLFSYFSAEEITELEALPAAEQKHRFFEHWTLKEAYIKARGAGFAIPLNQFGFHFKDEKIAAFRTHPDLNDPPDNWQFWQTPFDDRYEIALALGSNNSGIKLTMMKSVPLQSIEVLSPENISHLKPDH